VLFIAQVIVTLTISFVANVILLDVFVTTLTIFVQVIAHVILTFRSVAFGTNQFLNVSYIISTELVGFTDVYVPLPKS